MRTPFGEGQFTAWLVFDDPPSLRENDKARDTHYFSHTRQMRPNFCAGGEYLVRWATERDEREGRKAGTPITSKTRGCPNDAVFPTALCEDCGRREADLRGQLRERECRAQEPEQSFSRRQTVSRRVGT